MSYWRCCLPFHFRPIVWFQELEWYPNLWVRPHVLFISTDRLHKVDDEEYVEFWKNRTGSRNININVLGHIQELTPPNIHIHTSVHTDNRKPLSGTHTQIDTPKHTHIHTRTTRLHTWAQTKHTHSTHTYVHSHTGTHIPKIIENTHIYTRTHTFPNTYVYTSIQLHTQSQVMALSYSYIYTQTQLI